MSKLSKTALQLLREGREQQNGLIVYHRGHFTGRPRSPAYGSRKSAAAAALADAGLIEFVQHHHGVHHFIGGFSADHYTECVFRITEAGRIEAARLA